MRISELSRRANVPVATIKYYLREGLLPRGAPTAATQAEYGEGHVQRLRLIRALADPGGLPLTTIRRILDAVDDEDTDLHELLGTAHYATGPGVDASLVHDPEWAELRAHVDALLADLGWDVAPAAPARHQLTHALTALRRLGMPCSADDLQPYAEAAQAVAFEEMKRLDRSSTRAQAVETAVAATVLYEPVLLALRRLAQEHESGRRYRGRTP